MRRDNLTISLFKDIPFIWITSARMTFHFLTSIHSVVSNWWLRNYTSQFPINLDGKLFSSFLLLPVFIKKMNHRAGTVRTSEHTKCLLCVIWKRNTPWCDIQYDDTRQSSAVFFLLCFVHYIHAARTNFFIRSALTNDPNFWFLLFFRQKIVFGMKSFPFLSDSLVDRIGISLSPVMKFYDVQTIFFSFLFYFSFGDKNIFLPKSLPAGKTGALHVWQKHCITESLTNPISILMGNVFFSCSRRSFQNIHKSCNWKSIQKFTRIEL